MFRIGSRVYVRGHYYRRWGSKPRANCLVGIVVETEDIETSWGRTHQCVRVMWDGVGGSYWYPAGDLIDASDTSVFVNVYDKHMAYGGPEEGGWWYDVYEPVASYFEPDPIRRQDRFDREKDLADEVNGDRPEYHSVRSEGSRVVCLEDEPADVIAAKQRRPQYC